MSFSARSLPAVVAASEFDRLIEEHVFCRGGQAVTRLADAGLFERPMPASSEVEIYEWWLVSDPLATRLAAAGACIARFGELCFWGRSESGGALGEDAHLTSALLGRGA